MTSERTDLNPTITTKPDGSKIAEWKQINRVITLEDLIDKAEIDMERWKVDYHYANSWETPMKGPDDTPIMCTNYHVKAKFVPNTEFLTMEALVGQYKESIEDHSPKYRPVNRKPIYNENEAVMIVMDLFDLHVAMLAWGEETRGADWDSKIVQEEAMKALERLIHYCAPYPIEKILFPIGNDLFDVDNKMNTTSNNTPRDVDTRYLKMFRRVQNLMIAMIDRLREIAPVEVLVIPGNHDQERSAYLGETINAWYRNDSEVIVDNRAGFRKYKEYGVNLIGFTHGKYEKMSDLPLLMAKEEPEAWGRSTFQEFHTGHVHRKSKKVTTTTQDYNGVVINTIPSLCPRSSWGAMKGYLSRRAAECYIYNRKHGPAGHFAHPVESERSRLG